MHLASNALLIRRHPGWLLDLQQGLGDGSQLLHHGNTKATNKLDYYWGNNSEQSHNYRDKDNNKNENENKTKTKDKDKNQNDDDNAICSRNRHQNK